MDASLTQPMPWGLIQLPVFYHRPVAYTIPEEDELRVLSDRGLHEVTLAPVPSVHTHDLALLDASMYDVKRGVITHGAREWPCLGYHGGTPIRESADGWRLRQVIYHDIGNIQLWADPPNGPSFLVAEFFDCDTDFVNCTFSRDGRYLVLGWSDGLLVFRREG